MSNISTLDYTNILLIDTGRPPASMEEPGCVIAGGRLQIGDKPALRATNGWIRVATAKLKKGTVLIYGPDNGPWQLAVLPRDLKPGNEWLRYNPNSATEQREMLREVAEQNGVTLRP